MAFDEELAERIREVVAAEPGVTEKRMFGGDAFLIGGNLAVSASGQGGLLLRVDPADTERLVAEAHVDRFEMRGRPMNGWLRVDREAVPDDATRRSGLGSPMACATPARCHPRVDAEMVQGGTSRRNGATT